MRTVGLGAKPRGCMQVVGVLDITGDYRLVRPQLLGTIVQYALEIEERLATSIVPDS